MKNKNFIKAIIIGLCVAVSAVLYMVTIPKETEEMDRLESEKEEGLRVHSSAILIRYAYS